MWKIHREPKRTQNRLRLVEQYCRTPPEMIHEKIAVLVIDMQKVFADLWTDSDSSRDIGVFRELVRTAKNTGCLIVRTRHGHTDPQIDGGMLHRWWGSSIIENSEAYQFMEGFEEEPDEIIIPKKRYSSFLNTTLDAELSARGISTVIIGGVMTNLCCETTARDAFCRDYNVIFLADGTAADTEPMQCGTLLNLAFGFAHIFSCRQAQAWLKGDWPVPDS